MKVRRSYANRNHQIEGRHDYGPTTTNHGNLKVSIYSLDSTADLGAGVILHHSIGKEFHWIRYCGMS